MRWGEIIKLTDRAKRLLCTLNRKDFPVISTNPADVKIYDFIVLHGTYYQVNEIQKLQHWYDYERNQPFKFYRFFTFDTVSEYRVGSFVDIKENLKVDIIRASKLEDV